MAARRFVLVASPLVGPAGWRWVAEELTGRGHEVVLPALAPSGSAAPVWRAHVEHVLAQMGTDHGRSVVVGHSAAGRLIPLVADRLNDATCVYVDAQLPSDRTIPDDDWFRSHLRGLAVNGMLPPWSTWWGEGAWEALVPDAVRRAELEDTLPWVSLESAEELPPLPHREVRSGYLRFSDLFADLAAEANSRGWPTQHLPGQHLHMAVDEQAVTVALEQLADQLLTV